MYQCCRLDVCVVVSEWGEVGGERVWIWQFLADARRPCTSGFVFVMCVCGGVFYVSLLFYFSFNWEGDAQPQPHSKVELLQDVRCTFETFPQRPAPASGLLICWWCCCFC